MINIVVISIFISFALAFSFEAFAGSIPVRTKTEIIVVHHSDTPDGNAERLRKYHIEKRGWSDIGYHFVICRDGKIEEGRQENLVGAHAKSNGRNWISIGICLVGENEFTDEQIKSLKELLKRMCKKYNISDPDCIQRHHEKCPGPGLDLEKISKEVLRNIRRDS